MNFTLAAHEMGKLAILTRSPGWSHAIADDLILSPNDVLNYKAIDQGAWKGAFFVALELWKSCPKAPQPVPGADPEGFVWLTYEAGDKRVAIELRTNLYAWTLRADGGDRRHVSGDLRHVAEALRAVFGE